MKMWESDAKNSRKTRCAFLSEKRRFIPSGPAVLISYLTTGPCLDPVGMLEGKYGDKAVQ